MTFACRQEGYVESCGELDLCECVSISSRTHRSVGSSLFVGLRTACETSASVAGVMAAAYVGAPAMVHLAVALSNSSLPGNEIMVSGDHGALRPVVRTARRSGNSRCSSGTARALPSHRRTGTRYDLMMRSTGRRGRVSDQGVFASPQTMKVRCEEMYGTIIELP